MKNKQIFSESTPPRHKGLFAKFFALFFCLVMGMNVWGADPVTVSCASATATSSTGNTNKSSNGDYDVYFVRGGGGWSVNSGKGYQGKTDAIAVFELAESTDVTIILNNNGTSNRTFTMVAKPFTSLENGEEFLSILEYSNANAKKYADCVSSSKNLANLPTTSVFYNGAVATDCSLNNAQLGAASATTGDQTLNGSAANAEFELSATLSAGVYAIGFSACSNSAISLAGFKFTPAGGSTAVCPSGLTIASKDDKTAFLEGDKIELSAKLTAGNGSISYQWYKDEVAISGATDKNYTVNSCVLADAGSYTCKATKTDCTDQVSEALVLTVAEVAKANFSLAVTNGYTENVNSKATHDITASEATISGGTAQLYNGAGSAKPVMTATAISLSGSSSSYLKITFADGAKLFPGCVIKVDTKNTFKLTATNSSSNALNTNAETGAYTVTATDILNGSNTLYVWKNGGSTFTTIKVYVPVYKQVSFDAGDGTGTMDAVDVEVGEQYTIPTCTFTAPTGKEFDAWTSSDVTITDGKFTMPANNVTLTATWKTAVVKYTVTYAKGDEAVTGDVPTQESLAAGANFTVADKGNLAWASHVFTGWKDQDETAVAAGAEYTMPAKDVTLTAQWNVVTTYDVTFNLQGHGAAIETQHVIEGEKATEPADPKAELYTFGGWYTEAECTNAFDFANTTITAAKELFAKWTAFGEATSINIEQFVIEYGKSGDIQAALTAANFDFNLLSGDELDDLVADESKNDKNCAFRGLKLKHDGSFVVGNIPAGKLVDVVLGNLGAAKVQINGADAATALAAGVGTTNKTTPDNYKNSHNYYYSETAAVLKVLSTGTSTTVLKGINFLDPFVVTFANGGDVDPISYKAAPIVLPAATGEGEFQGWYDAETAGTKIGDEGDEFTPTGNVTLYAQFSSQSTNNEIASFTYGETTVTATEGKREYAIELPYKSEIPASITVTKAEEHATVSEIAKDGGVFTFSVTAESGEVANYTVTFTVAKKDGICIIEAALTGATAATVTGAIGGTADVNVTSGTYKMDKGKYIGVALANDGKFQAGDVVVLNVTDKQNATGFALYTEKEGTNLIIDTRDGNVIANGEYRIVLPEEYAGSNAIYAVRLNNSSTGDLNACVNNMKVYRAMNPVLVAMKVAGVDATISEGTKTVTVGLAPGTDLSTVALTDVVIASNTPALVEGVLGGSAWEADVARSYTLTDKDGDATVYNITISIEETCPTAVTISGTKDYTAGAEIELTASQSGSNTPEAISYQWYKDGILIEGATSAIFAKTATMADAGVYTMKINQTGCDEITSGNYTVTVAKLPVSSVAITEKPAEGNLYLKIGESVQLHATFLPLDATETAVTWYCSSQDYFDFNTTDNPTTVTAKEKAGSKDIKATIDGKSAAITIVNYYEYTFVMNGGNAEEPMKYVGSTVTLPTPTHPNGFEFVQWCKDEALTIKAGDSQNKFSDKAHTTLYAKWLLPNAETPVIEDLPATVNYAIGETIEPLVAVATVNDGGTLSYQWYNGSTVIEGATAFEFTPEESGNYKVVVTNTLADHNPTSATSSVAKVTIAKPLATLQPVTASAIWDWKSGVTTNQASEENFTNEVLANVEGVVYDDAFHADQIQFTGTWGARHEGTNTDAYRYYMQATQFQMNFAVAGKLVIYYRGTGASNAATVIVNGETVADAENGVGNKYEATYPYAVQPGMVTVDLVGVSEGKPVRICKIEFTTGTVVAAEDEHPVTTVDAIATLCSEKDIIAHSGGTFYYVSANDNGALTLTEATGVLHAGYPYIYVSNGQPVQVVYGTGEATEPKNHNGLYATFVNQPLGDGYAIIKNNKYYRTHDGNNNGCYAHHCYIKLDEIAPESMVTTAPGEDAPAPVHARRVVLGTNEGTVATDINALDQNVEAQKILLDGAIIILRGGKMYNVNGQLLK